MKIIVIGDIHGRDTWKKIIEKISEYDKIVFMGDYFDSWDIKGSQQIVNFKEIIKFKKANTKKVELLFGNHDYHYLPTTEDRYSGFNELFKFDIGEQLVKAIDNEIVKMCYADEENKILFTHAGVSKTWLKNQNFSVKFGMSEFLLLKTLEDWLNAKLMYQPNIFKFAIGKNRSEYGDDVTQSPIWIRPKSLASDIAGRDISGSDIQIVGHTEVKQIEFGDHIINVDALRYGEFLLYETEPTIVVSVNINDL